MSAYGVHPTRYENLSDGQLYSMFRESIYSSLGESQKLDLLQETVNRDALERGEIGAPQVRFADLDIDESGNAANGIINVNRDMAVHGVQSLEYNGQLIQHPVSGYNIESLNTVLHENIHCFQDQIIDGTITIEDAQKSAEYKANSFTTSNVLQDGKYHLGSQYLTGETANGYYLYYFQSTERDAYRGAEEKTASILKDLTEKYGVEPSFAAYEKSVEIAGYQAAEKEAAQWFQNPDFEKEINQILCNQYFGTNVQVDKNIETAVKNEMTATYDNLQQSINNEQEKEDAKMSFDPYQPVSLEEYNETLRNSVNAYYEHALNDPSMSKEEAISSTAEMSERYLESVEEFQEMQNTTGIEENEGTIDSGVSESIENDSVDQEGPDNSVDNDGIDDGIDI